MLDEVSTESLTVTHIFDGEEVVTGGEDGQVWIATFATRRAAQTFIDWVQMAWMSIEGERRERSAVETSVDLPSEPFNASGPATPLWRNDRCHYEGCIYPPVDGLGCQIHTLNTSAATKYPPECTCSPFVTTMLRIKSGCPAHDVSGPDPEPLL